MLFSRSGFDGIAFEVARGNVCEKIVRNEDRCEKKKHNPFIFINE